MQDQGDAAIRSPPLKPQSSKVPTSTTCRVMYHTQTQRCAYRVTPHLKEISPYSGLPVSIFENANNMPAGDSSSALSNLDTLNTVAANGDICQVQEWLQQWQNATTPSPPRGPPKHPMLPLQPALCAAARGNHADIVDLLLAQGCHIDPCR